MRKSEREIKDPKSILEIVQGNVICRLALFDQHYPYIVPLNYGYSGNALYIHCAKEGKKLELIRRNNKVCFEIEDSYRIVEDELSCNWTTKYRSVIGFGEIEIITDNEGKGKGMDVIMQHHGKMENSYVPGLVDRMYILKLTIHEMTGKQST